MVATMANADVAIFAGGCFWCMEKPFDEIKGVESVVSGYTGGHLQNPTYEQVSKGGTGHTEAIKIVYDGNQVSYEELLKIFWVNIDPENSKGQFCDNGSQYRSEIFYTTEEQKELAEKSVEHLLKTKFEKVYTRVTKASEFFDAEEYHQKYYKKNPIRYKFYRTSCGRDRRLRAIWEGYSF